MALSKKNLLLLSSALLLLCGLVAGERGHSSQRRRTAIADRPIDAPIPSDDCDSDDSMMLGKGGMPTNSDNVGKGTKSSKDYKLLARKGTKSGKSAKSESYGKGSDMSMSMSMDMDIDMKLPNGKGVKMEKEMKSLKSEKSEKKLSKKDSKSEHGKPTLKPVMSPTLSSEPTPSCSFLPPLSSSPTSANSIPIRASPYYISYSPSTNIPTPKDLEELARLTREYLEDSMMTVFAQTSLTNLDDFLTSMVEDVFVEGEEPVIVQFRSTGLFNPSSIFLPTVRELNDLIQNAIENEAYLKMVMSVPNCNPFKKTENIAYTKITLTPVDEKTTTTESSSENIVTSGESSSSFVRAGVAAATAGVVVLAAGLAMLKSRRPGLIDDDDDDDDVQSFSPRKSSSEDYSTSTIAGETCNMSMDDASDHFSHWRTMKTYNNNNGTEGEEFEDEPLDSDDEYEKMTPDAVSLS